MKKGFTLVELLVVIAIIGILASVVVVYFPTATKSAKDSRIISAIGQARAVMATVLARDGVITSQNFSSSTPDEMQKLTAEVSNNGSSLIFQYNSTDQTKACIYAQLQSKSNYYFCADSSGNSKHYIGTTPCSNGVCQ
jgi:prepilin-type N-terminal cleavage/methylation domain-containing protein